MDLCMVVAGSAQSLQKESTCGCRASGVASEFDRDLITMEQVLGIGSGYTNRLAESDFIGKHLPDILLDVKSTHDYSMGSFENLDDRSI